MALFWLAVALAFGVGELLTLAFYSVFVVIGALAASLAAAAGAPPELQVVVMAVVSVLGVAGARPPLMRYVRRRQAPELRSGASAMIGQTALVVDGIGGSHEPGHVRIAGEDWPAVTDDGAPLPEGRTIRVVALRQATLVVAPVQPAI